MDTKIKAENLKIKESENRAVNMITDLNLDLKMFLDKFVKFRKEFNVTDINLFTNLEMMYQEIAEFIEENPQNMDTEDRTNIDLKILKQNGIKKIYVCDLCQLELGEKSREMLRHVDHCHGKDLSVKSLLSKDKLTVNSIMRDLRTDSNKKDKKKKKEQKKVEKDKRITQGRKFPKKLKRFVAGDFGIFLDRANLEAKKLIVIPEYEIIKKNLYDTIKPAFPDLKIYFFGSRFNGLASSNSDLDIFFDIGNIYHKYSVRSDESKKINLVMNLLSPKPEWEKFETVLKARVPILRAYYVTDSFLIDCDISFSHGLGHLNTLLMKYIFDLQPICHKMCLFLKRWLKLTAFNRISTYSLVLMAVFFLQTKNCLPPIKDLQTDIKKPVEIGPWQGDFVEKSLAELKLTKIDATNQNCLIYLTEFFEYYTKFKFGSLIVCPYLGRPVKKQLLHESGELDNFARYKSFYLIDPEENCFQTSKPFCIMDPLELNHNIVKGVVEKELQIMKQYINETYEDLDSRKLNISDTNFL